MFKKAQNLDQLLFYDFLLVTTGTSINLKLVLQNESSRINMTSLKMSLQYFRDEF